MIRLGTMIFQLPFCNPIRLAQYVVLVNQPSMGRLEFGIGYGVWEHELVRWNLHFAEQQIMGAEALGIITKA
jgi:alkanesulfonate monooxygenase SsuD/methylene tetrahydromethanopterin reductase-like flavin-dependent oxidoreductase (luciferase family)